MSELNKLADQFIKENDVAKKNEIVDKLKADELDEFHKLICEKLPSTSTQKNTRFLNRTFNTIA